MTRGFAIPNRMVGKGLTEITLNRRRSLESRIKVHRYLDEECTSRGNSKLRGPAHLLLEKGGNTRDQRKCAGVVGILPFSALWGRDEMPVGTLTPVQGAPH